MRIARTKCSSRWSRSRQLPQALRKLVQHPICAGIYTCGRRATAAEYVDGALVKRVGPTLPLELARVCIHDHHDAYLTEERFRANLDRIADARPRWPMNENRGAVRDGLALLVGLLRCAHCGRKLRVNYKDHTALYSCGGGAPAPARRCVSFGSKLIDQHVGDQLCRALEPHAVHAARLALQQRNQAHLQTVHQARLRLQAAEYEAQRALEQYDLVDPKNRLVADTLEHRLNLRLGDLASARQNLDAVSAAEPRLTPEQSALLDELAGDFAAAWHHPHAPNTTRKQMGAAPLARHPVMRPS